MNIVARRYAEALLNVSTAGGRQTDVADDLEWVRQALLQAAEVRALFTDPRLAIERKLEMARRAFGEHVGVETQGLLHVLIRKRRFGLVLEVADAYAQAYQRQQGVATAEIRVARALDVSVIEKIVRQAERVLGLRLTPRVEVDPAVLGGVSLRVNDKLFDGSVRHRLKQLRQQLHHVRVA